MKLLRAKHLLVTVTAIFSLFVSAVSACACSHHEPVREAVESSCHGPSHEAPAVETSTDSRHFESDCNCFVRTPVPAIVAKKDDKRATVEKQIDEVSGSPIGAAVQLDTREQPLITFEPPLSNFKHALLESLPSRAPPRL